MKKEFAVRTLKRIKEIEQTYYKLKALGVDLIDYENGINLLEESIVLLFVKDEDNFEKALHDVQWWLYESVDKIITLGDKSKVDVNSPEAFIDWLERWYDVVERSEQLSAFVDFYNSRKLSHERINSDEIDIFLESI